MIIKGKRQKRTEARGLTNDVWALIERCWAQDPKARPTIDVVIEELSRIHEEQLTSETS